MQTDWTTARSEINQLAWAVLLIDIIAVGLGMLAAQYMGPEARLIGLGLAAFVTLVFALIVAGNLIVVALVDWVRVRQRRKHRHDRTRNEEL